MNNEFLKGIQARERVVSLKKIVRTDSIQLSLYKDSIIPNFRLALDTAKVEIVRLDTKVRSQAETIKTLKNGYYNCIVDGLRQNKSYKEIAGCRTRDGKKGELDVWGTTSKGMMSTIEQFKGREDIARKIDHQIPK